MYNILINGKPWQDDGCNYIGNLLDCFIILTEHFNVPTLKQAIDAGFKLQRIN